MTIARTGSAALFTWMFSCGMATAGDVALFGLHLDKPVNLPECPVEVRGEVKRGLIMDRSAYFLDYAPLESGAKCLQRDTSAFDNFYDKVHPSRPIPTLPPFAGGVQELALCYGDSVRPQVMALNCAKLYVTDGRLEGLMFVTPEPGTRDPVLNVLVEKFGKPVAHEPRASQNGYGARIEGNTYVWDMPAARAVYDDLAVNPLVVSEFQTEIPKRRGRVFIQSRAMVSKIEAFERQEPAKDKF